MKKVLVVGGGPVGALLALFLKRRGFEVEIFEKRQDPRREKIAAGRSINLILTSRGLNALEKLGLIQETMKITVPVTGRMMHAKNGETTFQPYGRDASEANLAISRGELNNLLLNQCEKSGIKLQFGAELTLIEAPSRKAHFKSHKSESLENYDLLVGADGAGSQVRKNLITSMPSIFREEIWPLGADYKELTMPLMDEQPALAKNALHIWPRGSYMLMALPNLDGTFTMTIYLPLKGERASFEALQTNSRVAEFFQSEFPDAAARMPNHVHEFATNPQGFLGTVRTNTWVYEDSIALIGDAAHAIVPFFGQGMNCGFEDCTVLDTCLAEAAGEVGPALKEYDRIQRPNANAIAEMAIENYTEMSSSVGDAKFLLKKKVEALLEQKMPAHYRSRYGMITYTLIPYRVAQAAGRIQEKILNHLVSDISEPGQVDWKRAEVLVKEKWLPFTNEHHLEMEKYQPKK